MFTTRSARPTYDRLPMWLRGYCTSHCANGRTIHSQILELSKNIPVVVCKYSNLGTSNITLLGHVTVLAYQAQSKEFAVLPTGLLGSYRCIEKKARTHILKNADKKLVFFFFTWSNMDLVWLPSQVNLIVLGIIRPVNTVCRVAHVPFDVMP